MLRKLLIKYFTYVILGLAFIGIFDTSYINYTILFNDGECDVLGTSCGAVLNSEYSQLFTVPLSLWGLVFYVTIFILGFKVHFYDLRYIHPVVGFTLLGALFSWYLFYLQSEVIGEWCSLCLISFGLSNALFLFLSLMHFIFPVSQRPKFHFSTLFSGLKTLVWVALIFLLLFKFSLDYGESKAKETVKIESIVAIIEDEYITLERIDPLINNLVFAEKIKIKNFRSKAINFLLLEKAAETEGVSLKEYLLKEKIIEQEADYSIFLDRFYVNPSKKTKELIEDLKKKFFYREILF